MSFCALVGVSLALPSCPTTEEPAPPENRFSCLTARVTVGTNSESTILMTDSKTGDAQYVGAVAFQNEATGEKGNVIGWIPLGDLAGAFAELAQREQAAEQAVREAAAIPRPRLQLPNLRDAPIKRGTQ